MSKPWREFCATHGLTQAETVNAALMCKNFHNDEIAKILKVSHGTVKNVNRAIFRKVGVNSRLQFVLYARRWLGDYIEQEKKRKRALAYEKFVARSTRLSNWLDRADAGAERRQEAAASASAAHGSVQAQGSAAGAGT